MGMRAISRMVPSTQPADDRCPHRESIGSPPRRRIGVIGHHDQRCGTIVSGPAHEGTALWRCLAPRPQGHSLPRTARAAQVRNGAPAGGSTTTSSTISHQPVGSTSESCREIPVSRPAVTTRSASARAAVTTYVGGRRYADCAPAKIELLPAVLHMSPNPQRCSEPTDVTTAVRQGISRSRATSPGALVPISINATSGLVRDARSVFFGTRRDC